MRSYIKSTYPITLFSALTIIIISLSTIILLWDFRQQELIASERETIAITGMFVEQTERNFESINLVLKGVQDRLQSEFGSKFNASGVEVHLMLGTRALGMSNLDALYLMNESGQVINSSNIQGQQAGINIHKDFYREVLEGNSEFFYIDRPVYDPKKKEWFLYLARKVNNYYGNRRGLVIAAIGINHFEEIYKFLSLEQSRPVSLYRADGVLIASEPHRDKLIGQRAPEISDESLKDLDAGIRIYTHVKGADEREAHTLSRVPNFPLLLSVINDNDEALAAWREKAIPIICGVVVVTIFIIIIAGLMIRKVLKEHSLRVALDDATDLYQHTIDSVMDAIIAVDSRQRITLFNPAAQRMFGYESSEIIGEYLSILMPDRFRSMHHVHVMGFSESQINSRMMGNQLGIVGKRRDGKEFPIESTISKTEISGVVQLTAVLRDVTDRRQSELELREMNQQLRGLSASLQNVREQERTRIARELHDELGQQLTGLKLELSWLSSRIKEGKSLVYEKVDEMRHSLERAISSVRRISTELRPLMLDDLGLGEAISWQIEEFTKRTGIKVKKHLDALYCVKSKELETALFRIIQESLTNIMRYANANIVEIILSEKKRILTLSIQDDGIGIDETSKSEGFGLVSMRERANALGGEFSVASKKGLGVLIKVSFSLELPIFSEDNA